MVSTRAPAAPACVAQSSLAVGAAVPVSHNQFVAVRTVVNAHDEARSGVA
jgi:hypothetical protein